MKLFLKTIFPFSTTGAVCNLSLYENGEIASSSSESQFTESIELLNEFEITRFLFSGFSNEKNWEFYKSKLELNGYKCKILQLPSLPTEKSSLKDFLDYIKALEEVYQFIGKSNFKLFFPAQKKQATIEFLFASFLHLDRSLSVSDLEEYFLGNGVLEESLQLKLASYNKFLNTNPYLVLKKSPSLKGRAEVIQKEKPPVESPIIPAQIKAGEFELNLSALNGKEPETIDSNPSIELNLSSLTETETGPFFQEKEEDPDELLEDVLGFAENFDTAQDLDWDNAFADTGQKVEDNFTVQDNVFLEKGTTIETKDKESDEPAEDFTFSTLIDLDAISNGKIEAIEEEKRKEKSILDEFSSEDSDSRVPFPEVLNLDNLPLTEWEREIIPQGAQEKEPIQEEPQVPIPTVEINIDPSNTFIDRHIKDALTKEILVDDEDPRKKKNKDTKKDSKPVTIIVTAEKEEDVRPLSKEKLKKLSSDFNAIQLD